MGSIENGILATHMKKFLGVNYDTAKKMVKRIRRAIKDDKDFVKKYLPSVIPRGVVPQPEPNKNSHPTLHAVVHKFGTDQQCRDYLTILRWKNGPMCPKCKKLNVRKIQSKTGRTRHSYRCRACHGQFSVTSGTPLHGLHKLSEWFLTIYLMEASPRGIPDKQLERLLGVSSRTASSLVEQFREVQERKQTQKLFEAYISFHDHAKAREVENALEQVRQPGRAENEDTPVAHLKRWSR
jgi:transposase-like protein